MVAFEIEASRIWDQVLLQNLRAQEWFIRRIFDEGLTVARARQQRALLQEAVPLPKSIAAVEPGKADYERAPPVASKFDFRTEGWPAQFTSLWRVRFKR
jgi:hypothetical protein